MKQSIPIQPILLVIFLAVIALGIVVISQFRLFQSGSLQNSQDIVALLQEKFPDAPIHNEIFDPYTIVLIHNGESEQCKRAMRFIEGITENYPKYNTVTYVLEGQDYLWPLENLPDDSCWVDNNLTEQWLVYPTIFFKDTVYVGYGPATRHDIKQQMKQDI